MSAGDGSAADRRQALHRSIADELQGAIEAGRVGPDARLPSEIELARRFRVSRGTVRQALANLRHKGLIEAVPGRGYFVRAVIPDQPEERGRTVGVVVPSVARPYVPETLHAIEAELHERSYSMVVATSGATKEQQAGRVHRIVRDGIKGLIVYPIDYDPDAVLFKGLLANGFELVLIDRYLPGLGIDAVTSDNVGGAYSAVTHLIELGHERIGFVSTDNLTTTSVFERYVGYQQALVTHGLALDEALELKTLPVTAGLITTPAGAVGELVSEIARFLELHRPTAVFALHDVIAMYVFEAASSLGLRIPDDFAIVGFDDDPVAAAHVLPLTTVAQPREEMGRRAAELLVDRLEGRSGHGGRIVLPPRLVVRRSSGAAIVGSEEQASA